MVDPVPAAASRPNPLPHLDVGSDPAACRVRTMVIITSAVVIVATLMLMVLGGRPLPGWKIALLAVLVLPALRTSLITVMIGLADLLLLDLVSWPGLGGWTSVAVLTLHLAATSWFLGSTIRPSAWLHRSALRLIAARFAWTQAVAQIGVLVAIVTADRPSDQLISSLGILTLLGLGASVVVVSHRAAAASRAPGSR